MKHIGIVSHGYRLSLKGERLLIRNKENDQVKEIALSRIKTITVSSTGVSVSSDLILKAAQRGIAFHFLDFRGESVCSLLGFKTNGNVKLREKQYIFRLDPKLSFELSRSIVMGKLRNQRSVLLYFSKYRSIKPEPLSALNASVYGIDGILIKLKEAVFQDAWRNVLMGHEGLAAKVYWNGLKEAGFLGSEFSGRHGRGAIDVFNQSLNYGYALLSSAILRSIHIAGLDSYGGIFHSDLSGRQSLVADLIEEFRPWCVDRLVISRRGMIAENGSLTKDLKQKIKVLVLGGFLKRYMYFGSRLTLESIFQRQMFRVAATISDPQKPYKPYVFKW